MEETADGFASHRLNQEEKEEGEGSGWLRRGRNDYKTTLGDQIESYDLYKRLTEEKWDTVGKPDEEIRHGNTSV